VLVAQRAKFTDSGRDFAVGTINQGSLRQWGKSSTEKSRGEKREGGKVGGLRLTGEKKIK
jgi:hypothetical protein